MDQPLTVLLADTSLVRQAFIGDLFPSACRLINLTSLAELEDCLLNGEFQPDVLMLSLALPGLDMGQFMGRWQHQLQRSDADLVVIGPDDAVLETRALVSGASLYLPLPLNTGLVEARLGVLLQKRTRISTLEALSVTDGLTGIANRRRFDEVFSREWRWAQRHGQGIGVLMLDLDAFKGYNDTLGHPAGDKVLRRIASILNGQVNRSHDLVARYGGEEFAVILPATDQHGVEVVAQRMLNAVRMARMPHPQSPCSEYVSVSIGSSWQQPQLRDRMEALVEDADQALYHAKETGRNRICSATAVE